MILSVKYVLKCNIDRFLFIVGGVCFLLRRGRLFSGLGRVSVSVWMMLLLSVVLVGCVSDQGDGSGDGVKGDSDLVEVEYIK